MEQLSTPSASSEKRACSFEPSTSAQRKQRVRQITAEEKIVPRVVHTQYGAHLRFQGMCPVDYLRVSKNQVELSTGILSQALKRCSKACKVMMQRTIPP